MINVRIEFSLTEEQRQMVLLGLAMIALERPGWDQALEEIAEHLKGVELFRQFKWIHGDQHGQDTSANQTTHRPSDGA